MSANVERIDFQRRAHDEETDAALAVLARESGACMAIAHRFAAFGQIPNKEEIARLESAAKRIRAVSEVLNGR